MILVIGDIMLDEYVEGTVSRVSPESCCPILEQKSVTYHLGGAANVAYQIKESGRDVCLCGIIGNDATATIVNRILNNENIQSLLFEHTICTTKKTRFVNSMKQQMLRLDNEESSSFVETEISNIENFIKANREKIDTVVFSDYNKGVLTDDVCSRLISLANNQNLISVVDIKVPSCKRYAGATIIKGNKKEFEAFYQNRNIDVSLSKEEMVKLRHLFGSDYIIVTLGSKGMFGVDATDHDIECKPLDVAIYDVTGAGDLVTAYVAMFINHISFKETLEIANKAAGVKVSRFGNSVVRPYEVMKDGYKIKGLKELLLLIKGKKVVFTNGCFDIIHAGHIDLIRYAKSKGDILIVALNGDDSIKRLKGETRPINNFEARAAVLSAMEYVDYIIRFDEDTPISIIKEIKPSYLIKGGDYKLQDIVGYDFVQSYGGIVESLPFKHDISTTRVLSSIK